MIGAAPLGVLAIGAAPDGPLVQLLAGSAVGIATTALQPIAYIGLAGSAAAAADATAYGMRVRGTAGAVLGQATAALAYGQTVSIAGDLIGFATATASARFATFIAADVVGTATTRLDPEGKFYAATREFITRPDDLPGSQPFLGTLQKALRLDRSIIGTSGFDRVTVTWGHVELINAEGDYDELVNRYTVDGRRFQMKAGVAGLAYNGFVTLFDGTVSNWHVAEDVLRIEIRDNTYLIEVPASSTLYAGTGDVEGTSDLKGKRRPRALGEVANVTPPLVIPSLLTYQVNAGPVQAISAVYDRGVALTFAGDFATVTALNAATPIAGTFITCLAAGWFRLGGQPAGQITCDVLGDATGGVYVNTTAGIVRRLLATVPGASIRVMEAAFGALDAAQPAVVGYWLDVGAETTVADIIADLMAGIGGWGGFRRGGAFEVGVFRAATAPPSARYDRADVIDLTREPLPDGLSPPPWRWRVAWGRNWTVQTDVAGQSVITAARVAFLAESYRLAVSDATAGAQVRADHILAQDPDPVLGFFRDEADAKAEADRRLALFRSTAALYRMRLKAHPFVHEIGEAIQLTFPRWDLRAGRLLRIVSLTEDTDEGTTELVGYG